MERARRRQVLLCLYQHPALIVVLGKDLKHRLEVHGPVIAGHSEDPELNGIVEVDAELTNDLKDKRTDVLQMDILDAVSKMIIELRNVHAAEAQVPCVRQQIHILRIRHVAQLLRLIKRLDAGARMHMIDEGEAVVLAEAPSHVQSVGEELPLLFIQLLNAFRRTVLSGIPAGGTRSLCGDHVLCAHVQEEFCLLLQPFKIFIAQLLAGEHGVAPAGGQFQTPLVKFRLQDLRVAGEFPAVFDPRVSRFRRLVDDIIK